MEMETSAAHTRAGRSTHSAAPALRTRERIRRAANRLIERFGSSLSLTTSASASASPLPPPSLLLLRAHPPQSAITIRPGHPARRSRRFPFTWPRAHSGRFACRCARTAPRCAQQSHPPSSAPSQRHSEHNTDIVSTVHERVRVSSCLAEDYRSDELQLFTNSYARMPTEGSLRPTSARRTRDG